MPMSAAIGIAANIGSFGAMGQINAASQAQAAQNNAYANLLGLQNGAYQHAAANYASYQAAGLGNALQNIAPGTGKAWQRNSRGETFAEWLSALEAREQSLDEPMSDDERIAWEVDLREWEVLRAPIR